MVDENLPPALARSLDALFVKQHEIIHLRDRYGPAVTDLEWISELSAEGRWAIISGDRRITRVHAEYQAFRNSRLTGFFLSRGLNKAPVTKQMERILALWNVIEQQAGLVTGGFMFQLPMKSTKLEPIKL